MLERDRVMCEGCGNVIDAAAPGNAQFMAGWSPNRPKGTNQLAMAVRSQRWMCRFCLDKRRAGVPAEQIEIELFP